MPVQETDRMSGFHSQFGDNVKIYQGVTIYAGASVLGGETVIGKNAVIGGNAFITSSIPANTRVSIKNQELEYKTGNHKRKTEEIQQSGEWYYVI